jgi:transposase-like protein
MEYTTCPDCRHTHALPTEYTNRRWRCPDCRTPFMARPSSAPPQPKKPRRGWLAATFARFLARKS